MRSSKNQLHVRTAARCHSRYSLGVNLNDLIAPKIPGIFFDDFRLVSLHVGRRDELEFIPILRPVVHRVCVFLCQSRIHGYRMRFLKSSRRFLSFARGRGRRWTDDLGDVGDILVTIQLNEDLYKAGTEGHFISQGYYEEVTLRCGERTLLREESI